MCSPCDDLHPQGCLECHFSCTVAAIHSGGTTVDDIEEFFDTQSEADGDDTEVVDIFACNEGEEDFADMESLLDITVDSWGWSSSR